MTWLPLAAGGEHELEWVLLAILVGLTAMFVLAYLTTIPYPIWLTVGGCALAFAPGIPDVKLEPDLVLIIALPPLLYAAALYSDLRELRRNIRPIGLLAVGLVLFTTLGIAAIAHMLIDGLSWEAAFVLGAVLGPTDPVAATAIAGRVGAPRRVVSVLEGESLINDATALTAFKFAVAAATAGTFSLSEAAGEFVLSVAGGLAIGAAVGIVVVWVRMRVSDGATQSFFSLVSAYFAYLPADALGASGVVAAVTTGIYVGWNAPRLVDAQTRLQLYAMWDVVIFLLNSMLFVLVGLQLPTVLDDLQERDPARLALYALVIALAVMAIRFAWVFPATYLPRLLFRRVRERDPYPQWQGVTVVAFTGMRGAVSLAAALAVPESVVGRDLIVFLCFTTILWTVCVEGLSLPMLLRRLGVREGDGPQREEDKARLLASEAALARVEELAGEPWVREDTAERVRAMYRFRSNRFRQRLGKEVDGVEEDIDERSLDYQRLLREMIAAQRGALMDLRRTGRIGDDVMRRVQRDLDLEESRLN